MIDEIYTLVSRFRALPLPVVMRRTGYTREQVEQAEFHWVARELRNTRNSRGALPVTFVCWNRAAAALPPHFQRHAAGLAAMQERGRIPLEALQIEGLTGPRRTRSGHWAADTAVPDASWRRDGRFVALEFDCASHPRAEVARKAVAYARMHVHQIWATPVTPGGQRAESIRAALLQALRDPALFTVHEVEWRW